MHFTQRKQSGKCWNLVKTNPRCTRIKKGRGKGEAYGKKSRKEQMPDGRSQWKKLPRVQKWKSQNVGGDLSISQSRKNSSTSMSHLKTEWFILVTGRSHFFFLPETSRIIDCNTTEKQSIPLYVSCQKSQNSARGNTHRAKRCLPSKLL